MLTPQLILGLGAKIVVDIFAGGGGWSTAYELATGQHVHVAINHNPDALSMHEVNHPQTRHFIADVWEVCPREATEGRPVGWLHLSPDCTDHSQAKGGQPRRKNIRALAWVTVRWAGQVKPDIISLENVVQILKWGRLIAKRDKATGRVIKLDGSIAAPGERVPVQEQYLVPDPKQQGKHWRRLIAILRGLGYAVEWRELNAADYGAMTTRKRLFMLARRDGQPIVWPKPTHFKNPAKGQQPWRPAADGIDWTIEGKSIFGRERPLADATMRRIALGMKRYVLDSADPFIVPIANWSRDGTHSTQEPARTMTAWPRGGSQSLGAPSLVPATHQGAPRAYDMREPARTITAAHRGETMLSMPILAGVGGRAGQSEPRPVDQPGYTTTRKGDTAIISPVLIQAGYGEREGQAPRALDLGKPLGVVTAGGVKHAIAAAFLAQANGGFNTTPGHEARQPSSTITNTGSQQQLVTATLVTNTSGHAPTDMVDPVPVIATGGHHGVVSAHLTAMSQNVMGSDLREPAQTILAGATRYGMLEYDLSPDDEAGALRVAAFLMRYHGLGGQWSDLHDPSSTITTRDRLALVTVYVRGTPYVIVDIRLRMLTPPELYRLQGFPAGYVITHGHDGRKFTKSEQVHMVGNSVSPPPAIALIAANASQDLFLRKAA